MNHKRYHLWYNVYLYMHVTACMPHVAYTHTPNIPNKSVWEEKFNKLTNMDFLSRCVYEHSYASMLLGKSSFCLHSIIFDVNRCGNWTLSVNLSNMLFDEALSKNKRNETLLQCELHQPNKFKMIANLSQFYGAQCCSRLAIHISMHCNAFHISMHTFVFFWIETMQVQIIRQLIKWNEIIRSFVSYCSRSTSTSSSMYSSGISNEPNTDLKHPIDVEHRNNVKEVLHIEMISIQNRNWMMCKETATDANRQARAASYRQHHRNVEIDHDGIWSQLIQPNTFDIHAYWWICVCVCAVDVNGWTIPGHKLLCLLMYIRVSHSHI